MVSSCWKLKDIIDAKKVSKSFDVPFKEYRDMQQYYDKLDMMSVSDIFDATPANVSILTKDRACSIRLPSKFAAKYPYPDAKECYKMFDITKYIEKNYMCYQFDPIIMDKSEKLEISEYALAPQAAGLIYRLFLNNTIFGDANDYQAYVKQTIDSPVFDTAFASSKFYERESNSSNSYLNIELFYVSIHIHHLAYPYDTRCLSCAPYRSCMDLYGEMMRRIVMNKFRKVTTLSPLFDNSLKLPVISAKHLMNETFVAEYRALFGDRKDAPKQCDLHYTSSKVTISYGSVVTISVYFPQDASTTVNHLPLQDPIDFILYICSTFGIWLGVSVLSVGGAIKNLFLKLKNVCSNDTITEPDMELNSDSNHGNDIQEMKNELVSIRRQLRIIQAKMVHRTV